MQGIQVGFHGLARDLQKRTVHFDLAGQSIRRYSLCLSELKNSFLKLLL